MQLIYADRVKETSTTTGTGSYTLAGAATGFRSFAAIGDGYSCGYVAEDGTDWEVGIGTYTASGTLLSRDQICASSNAGAAVSWAAGTRNVFCTVPGRQLMAYTHDPSASNGLTSSADTPKLLNGALLCAGSQSVADGNWSISIGGYSRAVGSNALAIGASPLANADYTVSLGYNYSAGGASGIGAVAIGGTNSSANQSHASGNYAVNVGANGSNAAGIGSGTIAGYSNSAIGNYSFVMAGSNNTTNGLYSNAGGYGANARYFGANALGADASAGKAQAERIVQRQSTTDATTTPLAFNADAATNGRVTFPANSAFAVVAHVVGRETSTGDCIAFRLEGLVHANGSSVPSLVGTTPSAVDLGHSTGAATWTAVLAIDGTNNALLINVTGEASKTIKWAARLELIEVVA